MRPLSSASAQGTWTLLSKELKKGMLSHKLKTPPIPESKPIATVLEKKFAQTFSCFGTGPRWIFSFSVDWGWRSGLCRTVCSSVFTSATSLQAFSSFTLKLSSLAFCRFTISPSSLIVSNNCRISQFENTRFSRFLIEPSRWGSG